MSIALHIRLLTRYLGFTPAPLVTHVSLASLQSLPALPVIQRKTIRCVCDDWRETEVRTEGIYRYYRASAYTIRQ